MLSQLNHVIRKFLEEDSFIACTEVKQFRSGEIILFEHQTDRHLYFIESGEVCVRKNDRSDIYLGSGELLGEVSFLLGGLRTATIVSSEETQCRIILEDMFRVWLDQNVAKATLFYQSLGMSIAERLQLNVEKQKTLSMFEYRSSILQQSELMFQEQSSRLQDYYLIAQAKKTEIEHRIRDQLKELQTEQEKDPVNKRESLFVREITEESLFANNDGFLKEIYQNLRDQSYQIFSYIAQQLNRFIDQEKRLELAVRARAIFSPILQKTITYQELLIADFTESANLLSNLILEKSMDSCESALNQALTNFVTLKSYRVQLEWFADQIRKQRYAEISAITVINDLTGALFSLLYPLSAPYDIDIHFFVDNTHSFGCVDVNLQHYGQVRYCPQKIQDWAHDIIEGKILSSDQDIFYIPSCLDYIGDNLAVRLLKNLKENLKDGGVLIMSTLSKTNDAAFVCEFLGWSTIRRNKNQIEGLLNYAGFKNINITEQTGSLLIMAYK